MFDILSVDAIAGKLGIAPGEVGVLFQRLGLPLIARIDDCDFYSREQFEYAQDYLDRQRRRQEVSSVRVG
jgi:hypothetical protein